MVWFKSVDCEGFPSPSTFRNTNCSGFDAVPCNCPLFQYQTLVGNVTQEQRTAFYMSRRNANVNITPIYPWSRDVTATSNWDTYGLVPSYKDLCTRPEGAEVLGTTRLGVYLYKAPTNGLPPLNSQKCEDCLKFGKNCKTCEGVPPAEQFCNPFLPQ